MRTFVLFLFVVCVSGQQTATVWTYVKGNLDGPQDTSVFGNVGQADPTFHPSSRNGPAYWSDLMGNLWLYGGLGDAGSLGDLWMLSVNSLQWTWMGGNPSVTNTPANFQNCIPPTVWDPASFIDNQGNFWMFGGSQNGQTGLIDHIWMWNGAWNNMYADNGVNTRPTFGTQGVASTNNNPGARRSAAAWIDDNGNVWIFGGFGIDNNGNTLTLNDLWFYNNNNGWAWISGSKVGGAPNTATSPGARQGMSYWKDAAGNYYIYGGQNPGGLALNETWVWNIGSSTWTMLQNTMGPPLYWAPTASGPNGEVYIFGGIDIANKSVSDLWMWNGAVWNLVLGDQKSNQPSVFNDTNLLNDKPGGRSHSALWVSTNTNSSIWMFGGQGLGINQQSELDDLWRVSTALIQNVNVNITAAIIATTTVLTTTLIYDAPLDGIGVIIACLGIPFVICFIIAASEDCKWNKKRQQYISDTMTNLRYTRS